MNIRMQLRDFVRRHARIYALVGWPTRHRLLAGVRRWGTIAGAAAMWAALFVCDLLLRAFRTEAVLPYNSERIGHQVHEPRAYLARQLLSRRRRHVVFVVNKKKVANRYMHELWTSRCRMLDCRRSSWLRAFQEFAEAHPRGALKYICSSDEDKRRSFSEYIRIGNLVELPAKDAGRGAAIVEDLGIPRDAWLVCLHVREAGFLPHLPYHAFRDCDIASYFPAIRHITDAGGYVVRMGDPSMKPLPSLPRVLDYAHSPSRSDFLDIYLCRRCKFFIGLNSGLIEVPFLLHRPLVLANVVPFTDGYPDALFIPKLIREEATARLLTFREVEERGIDRMYCSEDYKRAGVRVVDNDEQDILALIREQMLKLDGQLKWGNDELECRERMDALFCARGFEKGACPVISPSFVRRHRELLAF